MSAHPPHSQWPPKRFHATSSSSKSDNDEPPGSLHPALASSQATSPSRTSSPVPLQQEQPQVNRDLSDREKFNLHYGVATKSWQEVLGMYSVHNVEQPADCFIVQIFK